jgi:hypothetical protein
VKGLSRQALLAAACVVFLAWFSMRFYMDNSNDSETEAYVAALLASAGRSSVAVDATGHYSALAPYVIWPFTTVLRPLTGVWVIRGFVFTYLLLALALYAAAYAWYRQVGLSWLTSLLGLVLLSTCVAFALLIRGWELDKLLEPTLFLAAALAGWRRRYVIMLALVGLAVLNRETGALIALVALAAVWREEGGFAGAITRWPVWVSLLVCVAGVALLRTFGPSPTLPIPEALQANLTLDRLVYVVGGLCLLPLFAPAWLRSAPVAVQRLFLLLAPVWLLLVLVTDRLEQGAVLLAPTALLLVPIALIGLQGALVRHSVS